jgi:predicted nucleic acid-binding protein
VILVDTSVLLDVLKDEQEWADRSEAALVAASAIGGIAIDDIVYAELSTRYRRIEDLDAAIGAMGLTHAPIPRAALFLAGKAFLRYRKLGGTRTGVLSDFFIGAHAAVEGWPLLTRDDGRVKAYFPTVELIAPA